MDVLETRPGLEFMHTRIPVEMELGKARAGHKQVLGRTFVVMFRHADGLRATTSL